MTVKRSAWWFLLPIFLGILGSAIAWTKLRDSEDPELLKWIMIFGAVQTIVIAIALGGMHNSLGMGGMHNSLGWPDNLIEFHNSLGMGGMHNSTGLPDNMIEFHMRHS